MSPTDTNGSNQTLNPVLSIAIVLVLLAVMTGVSLIIFWHSEAKRNIVLIQQFSEGDIDAQIPAGFFSDGINDDDILTVPELLHIRRNIEAEANKLAPTADFGGFELDEDKLGF